MRLPGGGYCADETLKVNNPPLGGTGLASRKSEKDIVINIGKQFLNLQTNIDMELTAGDGFVAEVRQVTAPADVIPVGSNCGAVLRVAER